MKKDTIGPEKKDGKAAIRNYSTFRTAESLCSRSVQLTQACLLALESASVRLFVSIIALQNDRDKAESREMLHNNHGERKYGTGLKYPAV